jgi:hypothetical protein
MAALRPLRRSVWISVESDEGAALYRMREVEMLRMGSIEEVVRLLGLRDRKDMVVDSVRG